MMLAASPFYSQYSHTPTRPSPLSERSTNAIARPFRFNMASQPQNEKKVPLSQREYKPNPVMQTRDAATQRRRDMFFRRVQNGRDDKKWEARGDQVGRLDYFSDQKRWEAQKAREASQFQLDDVDEDILHNSTQLHVSSSDPQHEENMDEAEYILTQEERELQELITSMEEEQENASQHYGSDDDDYDQIFMECTNSNALDVEQQLAQSKADFDDVMDITDG